MDLKDIAKGLADIGLPLLGAALPVPGGMALGAALASAVDDHLGTAAKGQPTVTLDNLVDTLTANAQAKEAALEFQARHAETILQIRAKAEQDAFDTEVKDRTDARGMQVNTRSFMPAVLSTIVVAGFLGILVAMMLGVLKTSDSQALRTSPAARRNSWRSRLRHPRSDTSGIQMQTAPSGAVFTGAYGLA